MRHGFPPAHLGGYGKWLLIVRRLLVVGADALELLIFHCVGGSCDFLLEPGQDAGLFHHDLVELFVLILHVREGGFELLEPGVNGRVHPQA